MVAFSILIKRPGLTVIFLLCLKMSYENITPQLSACIPSPSVSRRFSCSFTDDGDDQLFELVSHH